MTTGKTIALTRWTFVGKLMSLLFNMLSRLVIAFLPWNQHLLISCLQSPSPVIFESKKIKSVTVCIVCPSICHEVMGPDAMIFVFWMLSFKPGFHPSVSLSSRGPITSWQIEGDKVEVVTDFLFLVSRITNDGDYSHETRRRLLLGRKAMTNLASVSKSKDITLLTKVHIVKAVVFLGTVVRTGHKEGRAPKNWCPWTTVLEKTPESPLDSKEIKLVNLKGDQS